MATAGKIFICYRREDAADAAGRIRDWLVQTRQVAKEDIFLDVDAILPGANFMWTIENAISQCRAMIVVISPSWVAQTGSPTVSYVQTEVELALRKGIALLPVLVGGARMPLPDDLPPRLRPLTRLQALPIRADSFDYDMDRVKNALGLKGSSLLPWLRGKAPALTPPSPSADTPPATMPFSAPVYATPISPAPASPAPANPAVTLSVFISYSRTDKGVVERLVQALQAASIVVWIDHDRLTPGSADWEREIRSAITSSHGLIYAASEDAAASQYVRDEMSIARDNKIPIYPIWIRGHLWSSCVPLGWGHTQYADGRGNDFGSAVQAIIGSLTKAAGSR